MIAIENASVSFTIKIIHKLWPNSIQFAFGKGEKNNNNNEFENNGEKISIAIYYC